jgi:hypothetical protein
MYMSICESRMPYGAVIFGGEGEGVDPGWDTAEILHESAKNSRNAAKGAGVSGPQRDGRRGGNLRTAHNHVM